MPISLISHAYLQMNISSKIFSGGEINVRVDDRIKYLGYTTLRLKALVYNSNDLMELFMVIDAIYRLNNNVKLDLDIPYLPYARQEQALCLLLHSVFYIFFQLYLNLGLM